MKLTLVTLLGVVFAASLVPVVFADDPADSSLVNEEDMLVVDDEYARDLDVLDQASLAGLKSVCIVILDIDDEAEEYGLTERQIHFNVSLTLANAGIDFISREIYDETPGSAYLYIYVNLLSSGLNYVYNLGVSVSQEVSLIRDPEIALAGSTWRSEELGIIPMGESAKLMESINEKLHEFVEDHAAANPKE
jgi:hypothetical protein